MKKLIALMLTSVLLFCACSAHKSIQYTIYTSSFDGISNAHESIFSEDLSDNVTIGDFNQKDFSYVSHTKTDNPNASPKKELDIDGKTFELDFELSYITAIADSELGKNLSVGRYDSYVTDLSEGSLDVRFLQNTETLVFFSMHGNSRYIKEGDFNKERSKDKADALISSLYGESVLSKYTFVETTDIISQTFNGFSVYYKRYIYGYPTSESIMIKFNRNGDLISINAENFKLLDSAEKDITKTDIEAAEKALRDSVNKSWTLSDDFELVIDSTGGYYLSVVGTRIESDRSEYREPCTFYININ